MSRLGLIARCDYSGVSNQTWEVFRHLRPERTLVLRMDAHGSTRGQDHPERYLDGATGDDVCVTQYPPTDDDIRWLVRGCDVIYTAECPYHPGLNAFAAERVVRLVVHANPELFDPSYAAHGAEIWSATKYRRDIIGHDAKIVPFPVATDRFTPRHVTKVETLLHVGAPAMLDRNGSELVRVAANGVDGFDWKAPGEVTDYWDLYQDADALILPRRYAGLCLTMQEAAAAGLPIVMLASDPNALRTIPELRVAVDGWTMAPMKGGYVEVYDADPADLARTIDLLHDPDVVARASQASLDWAAEISWSRQAEEWCRRLGLECSEVAA